MTDWITRVRDHAIHGSLDTLDEMLAKAEARAADDMNVQSGLARLRHVANFARKELGRIDPLLASVAALDVANKSVAAMGSQAEQYASNGNTAHVDSANTDADRLVPQLSGLAVPTSTEDLHALSAAIASFGESTRGQLAELKEVTASGTSAAQRLESKVGELETSVSNEKNRLDQMVNQHQQQFSDGQDSRQQTFNASETQRKEGAEAKLKEWDKKFGALMVSQTAEFKEALDGLKEDGAKHSTSTSEASQELVSAIEQLRDKAKKLVGIIAGTGMAGGYQKDANEQRSAYFWWNMATLIGFAGLILFAVWLFVSIADDPQFSWPKVVGRLIAIVAFGLFAGYAGRMAMKHRQSERQHRHKQLALESVNPFLEDQDPKVQTAIKQKIAEVFFTQPAGSSEGDSDVVPNTTSEALRLASKALDKISKS